jgi:hypothetical protein
MVEDGATKTAKATSKTASLIDVEKDVSSFNYALMKPNFSGHLEDSRFGYCSAALPHQSSRAECRREACEVGAAFGGLLRIVKGFTISHLQKINEYEMGPFYDMVCTETGQTVDQELLHSLLEKNKKKIEEVDAEILDAEQNLGESEVRQAWLKKSEYLCQIGDKMAALTAFRTTYEKTVGIGYRIDLVFNLIRLGIFFLDHKLINANIAKAKDLMEQGGDWERKNRLRSYEALYKMAIRDMKGAAALFLETVPTFGSYELMTYDKLIFYTVITAVFGKLIF